MISPERTVVVSESGSIHLDFLRGMAAVLVVLGHIRYLFFTRFEELAVKSNITKAFYGLGTYGHVAVVIFFVLSGFWISSGILKRPISKFRLDRYLIQRLSRLYIVLIPALIFSAFLDGIGLSHEPWRTTYISPLPQLGEWTPAGNYTWAAFFGNLFFLQGIATEPFGSNSPLWSLSYEFWYYLLFPLNLWALLSKSFRLRAIGAVGSIAIALFLPAVILKYYAIWLLGALLVFLFQSTGLRRTALDYRTGVVSTLFFLCVILVLRPLSAKWNIVAADAAVAIPTAALIATIARTRFPIVPVFYRAFARLLADCSFTIYLVHMPVLVMIKAIVLPQMKWDPSRKSLACGLLVLLFSLAVAYVFSRWTEKHTVDLRRYLSRRFLKDSPAPAKEPEGELFVAQSP